jgi:hypothetical protein
MSDCTGSTVYILYITWTCQYYASVCPLEEKSSGFHISILSHITEANGTKLSMPVTWSLICFS